MKEREPIVATGLVALLLLLWLGFLFHASPRFAGSLPGGVLGIAGALLMLVPLAYMFVKRIPPLKKRVIKRLSMRTLLAWHIYAGILGPILALLHTGHKFVSPLGIALTAMTLVVVVSGFVGRYLMSQFSQEIREKKEMLTRLELAYQETVGNLAAHPEQAAILRPLAGFWSRFAAGFFVPSVGTVQGPLPVSVQALRLADAMADLEYAIKTHESFKTWFAGWLKFHMVISFALYGLLVLHVWAGIHFGLRWFMRNSVWLKRVALLVGLGIGILVLVLLVRRSSLGQAATWQQQASPGRLSAAHSFLENNCAACHTAVKGPEASKCIACHASNESLLQRQPTAFHADVGSCVECHGEHQGSTRRPTQMDHEALSQIGQRQLQAGDRFGAENDRARQQLLTWMGQHKSANHLLAGHPNITPQEAVLNCVMCHASKDRHSGFFGGDCAQCHATTRWTIPVFRHPAPSSLDCAQCHQAPPSHYMEHFHMVSMKVAGKPHAQVNQCYLCHQTTAWNDIKGVGWYKHH